jgi:hypothetical protein
MDDTIAPARDEEGGCSGARGPGAFQPGGLGRRCRGLLVWRALLPDWFGWLGGYRYYVDEAIVLAPDSDALHLVAMMRGKHPGVQVVARAPRSIDISATGSFHAGRLLTKAGREVVALNDGKARRSFGGLTRGLAANPVGYGLLAGLGTGLGFVVPPRWRCSRPACG